MYTSIARYCTMHKKSYQGVDCPTCMSNLLKTESESYRKALAAIVTYFEAPEVGNKTITECITEPLTLAECSEYLNPPTLNGEIEHKLRVYRLQLAVRASIQNYVLQKG
jgi:hypothetical protein